MTSAVPAKPEQRCGWERTTASTKCTHGSIDPHNRYKKTARLFSIHVFPASENVRTTKNRITFQHSAAITCLLSAPLVCSSPSCQIFHQHSINLFAVISGARSSYRWRADLWWCILGPPVGAGEKQRREWLTFQTAAASAAWWLQQVLCGARKTTPSSSSIRCQPAWK